MAGYTFLFSSEFCRPFPLMFQPEMLMRRSFRGSWFYLLVCDSGYLEVAWRSLYLWNSAVTSMCFVLKSSELEGILFIFSCFFSIALWKFSCFISFNMFLLLWVDFSLQESHLYVIGSSLSWILSLFFFLFFRSFLLLTFYFLLSSAFSTFVVIIKMLLL